MNLEVLLVHELRDLLQVQDAEFVVVYVYL